MSFQTESKQCVVFAHWVLRCPLAEVGWMFTLEHSLYLWLDLQQVVEAIGPSMMEGGKQVKAG